MRNLLGLQPLTLGILALGLAACGTQAQRPPSIVLVVADTLRADRLGVYGHEGQLTPFIDSLASEALVYENARSVSSWTAPSMASMFTSLYPSQHGVVTGFSLSMANAANKGGAMINRIPATVESLPEALRAAGYRTFGVADNPNIVSQLGFERGFDRFHASNYEGAEAVNAAALQWKSEIQSPEPFFLYLHYMDPHQPYHPRRPWFAFDEREIEGAPADEDGTPMGFVSEAGLRAVHIRRVIEGAQDAQEIEARLAYGVDLAIAAYESEIRYLDEHVRQIFEQLALDSETVVVFVSDHGEELGEHGSIGHPFKLYDELLSVPLILRLPPKFNRAGRINGLTSIMDIHPTLLEIAGISADSALAGKSLLGPMDGSEERELLAMRTHERAIDTHKLEALLSGGSKLIISSTSETVEFYDLSSDATEQHNLAAAHAAKAEQFKARLSAMQASLTTFEREFIDLSLDENFDQMMRDLGYLGDGE